MDEYKNLKVDDLVMNEWRGYSRPGWTVKPATGVQIVHRPTGAMVQVDSDVSHHKNKQVALDMLNTKVGNIMAARQMLAEASAIVTVRPDGHGGLNVTNLPPMPPVKHSAPEHESFKEWLIREMPEGTVIGNPEWWADKIARHIQHRLSKAF